MRGLAIVVACCSPRLGGVLHPFVELQQGSASDLRDLGVAALTRTPVSPIGVDRRASLLEHHAEIERARGIAALIRATICLLGLGGCALLLEQHAEI